MTQTVTLVSSLGSIVSEVASETNCQTPEMRGEVTVKQTLGHNRHRNPTLHTVVVGGNRGSIRRWQEELNSTIRDVEAVRRKASVVMEEMVEKCC